MTYKECYKLFKKADYIDIFTHDFYDEFYGRDLSQLQRAKLKYKKLNQFFKNIIKGRHGKGYQSRGKTQKDPVKALAINIYRYGKEPANQILDYKDWKKQTQGAIEKKDLQRLQEITDPDEYYVTTSGKNLQYDYEPGMFVKKPPQERLKKAYKKYLTAKILKQLNRDQSLIQRKLQLQAVWHKAYNQIQNKIRKEKLRGKKADQAWYKWGQAFDQTPEMQQKAKIQKTLNNLYPHKFNWELS